MTSLIYENLKTKSYCKRTDWWLLEVVGDIDEGGQKVLIKIFTSKVNTCRDIMYSIVSTENNTVLFGSCQ